jgi:hypothetical protein
MVKTRKNQKKQRGGFFGLNWLKPAEPPPSCAEVAEQYMTNEFNNDVTISSLQGNISKIDTCMGSNDINDADKEKLGGYSIKIGKKLAYKQAQYAKTTDLADADARKKHEQRLWNKKEAALRADLEIRTAQNAQNNNMQPTSMGGNRKSKQKSRKSRKNIKKSKNNKR